VPFAIRPRINEAAWLSVLNTAGTELFPEHDNNPALAVMVPRRAKNERQGPDNRATHGGGLNRSDKALRTPAFNALIDVMHEARLVRFGAGKAHLAAAFHAMRVFVEALDLALWHCPPMIGCWHALPPTVPQLERCGNQPEFAVHALDTLRQRSLGRPRAASFLV
jgi:hypothetical protein